VWCAIGTMARFRKIFDHAEVLFWGRVGLLGELDCVMAITLEANGAENGNGNGERQAPVFVVGCMWNMERLCIFDWCWTSGE
jgi:hypothetical protein